MFTLRGYLLDAVIAAARWSGVVEQHNAILVSSHPATDSMQ